MSNSFSSFSDLAKFMLGQKEVLTLEEACTYSGLSKSKMYKHTSGGKLPFYKPEGKKIYFKREDLENFLLRNRHSSQEELEEKAATRVFTSKTGSNGRL